MKFILLFQIYIYFGFLGCSKINCLMLKKFKIPFNHTQNKINLNDLLLNNSTNIQNFSKLDSKDNFAYKFVSFPKGNTNIL